MAWHISFLLAFHDLLFLTDSRRDCVSCWGSLNFTWFIASSIIWSFGSTPIMWLWTTQHANTTFTWVSKDQHGSASNTQKRFFNTPNPRSIVVLNEECRRLNILLIHRRTITELFQVISHTPIRWQYFIFITIPSITKIIFTYIYSKIKPNHYYA